MPVKGEKRGDKKTTYIPLRKVPGELGEFASASKHSAYFHILVLSFLAFSYNFELLQQVWF